MPQERGEMFTHTHTTTPFNDEVVLFFFVCYPNRFFSSSSYSTQKRVPSLLWLYRVTQKQPYAFKLAGKVRATRIQNIQF